MPSLYVTIKERCELLGWMDSTEAERTKILDQSRVLLRSRQKSNPVLLLNATAYRYEPSQFDELDTAIQAVWNERRGHYQTK